LQRSRPGSRDSRCSAAAHDGLQHGSWLTRKVE
jgi:hypothetical protein